MTAGNKFTAGPAVVLANFLRAGRTTLYPILVQPACVLLDLAYIGFVDGQESTIYHTLLPVGRRQLWIIISSQNMLSTLPSAPQNCVSNCILQLLWWGVSWNTTPFLLFCNSHGHPLLSAAMLSIFFALPSVHFLHILAIALIFNFIFFNAFPLWKIWVTCDVGDLLVGVISFWEKVD